ncbi:MAG: LptE family protein [Bacteroidaceae bacterium]|nr:LptE family protein [Bacteroidaceae bacterium]MBR5159051.1 LptE family protein [Bacteroidaceae bacterium]
MRHGILKSVITLFASALLLQGCKVSYGLNMASIDYNTTKTFSIETFTNRAAYQWAPMAPMFNTTLSNKYNDQTKLRQVRRDGDLALSGEITSYDQTNKTISADGYSSMVQLRMTVKVKFTNNKKHADDFERSFSASREYDSSQQLSAVQEELVQQMIDDIVDQVFNATVAKW